MTNNNNELQHEKTNYSFYLECMAYFAAAAVVAAAAIAFFATQASSSIGFAATAAATGPGGLLAGIILFAAIIALTCLFPSSIDRDHTVFLNTYNSGYRRVDSNPVLSSLYPYSYSNRNTHGHYSGGVSSNTHSHSSVPGPRW